MREHDNTNLPKTECSAEPPLPDSPSDHTLLLDIQEGSSASFNLLVKRHHIRFYRLAYRILNDRGNAEDIVQDAFLRLWEKPKLWDKSKSNKFTTWFYRIVVNLCYDKLKQHGHRVCESNEALNEVTNTIDDDFLKLEKEEHLQKQIEQLPRRQKLALTLCFFEGISNQDAADIMGLSLRACRSLVMRAKDKLKSHFEENEGDIYE